MSNNDHSFRVRFPLLVTALLGAMIPAPVLAQKAPHPAAAAAAEAKSERIVSLGGDATEILYALGLKDSIVAVDTTSLSPPAALKEKPNVGYMRALSAEGVLSTGATAIVANAQAGPPEVVSALKSANLRFLSLPGNETPHNVAEKVLVIGKAFGREEQAEALAERIEAGLRSVAERRKAITKPVRAIFVLGINNGRATVGGSDTTADTMMRLAGAVNAADFKGYKPLTSEALLSIAPDVVVTMRREGATNNQKLMESLPGYRQSPAGKNDRLIEMEGHYLLGFGPRTHEAALDLMSRLYPDLK
ncbi:MAG: hemin ABC transporter substrate-binding protein [Hyphomicrobiaceae bacterium]